MTSTTRLVAAAALVAATALPAPAFALVLTPTRDATVSVPAADPVGWRCGPGWHMTRVGCRRNR